MAWLSYTTVPVVGPDGTMMSLMQAMIMTMADAITEQPAVTAATNVAVMPPSTTLIPPTTTIMPVTSTPGKFVLMPYLVNALI